jgi:hypothetical protein
MTEVCCLNKLKAYYAVGNEHIRKFCEQQCLSEKDMDSAVSELAFQNGVRMQYIAVHQWEQ